VSAYAFVDLHIFDIEQYLEYQHALRPLLQQVGARYLARGGEFEVFEGHLEPERIVIMQFPSMEVLRDFYRSEAYQALEAQRTDCSRACIIGVSGLPEPAAP
jgi:uncharacterized protein (DUF1330 family)